MKGCWRTTSLAVVLLLLVATTVSAQQEYAEALDKAISPGYSSVSFEGTVYRFFSSCDFVVTFESVDSEHVQLHVRPLFKPGGVLPYYALSVQWGSNPAALLLLDESGSGSFTLGSETGYAEK